MIPHWSDDVMPCPHVITLGSVCTFCALCECLSTIPLQTLLNSVQSVFIRWHCFATTLSEGPTAMCVVCLSCVCVFVFDTAYVSICVLPLHSCVGDLDEHVGVCTCMLVCVSVLSLPPSLLLSVCILSLPTPLPIFIAGDVQSAYVAFEDRYLPVTVHASLSLSVVSVQYRSCGTLRACYTG